MAITSVLQKLLPPVYERSTDGRSATTVWTVKTDTDNVNLTDIENASGLPSRGESFPGDFSLQVTRKRAKKIGNKRTYEVTVTYEARTDGEDAEEDDPLAQPAQISYSTVFRQEKADIDIHGFPLYNSADEPFDPAIMVDTAGIVMSVTRNVAEFTIAGLAAFMNTVNADVFMGLPAGTCRVVGIRSLKVTTQTPFYFRATVDVEIRMTEDAGGNVIGWKRLILSQGFSELDDNGDRVDIYIKNSDGKSVRPREPLRLDIGGQRMAVGQASFFMEYDVYKAVPFAGMNLGV